MFCNITMWLLGRFGWLSGCCYVVAKIL